MHLLVHLQNFGFEINLAISELCFSVTIIVLNNIVWLVVVGITLRVTVNDLTLFIIHLSGLRLGLLLCRCGGIDHKFLDLCLRFLWFIKLIAGRLTFFLWRHTSLKYTILILFNIQIEH